MSVIHEEIFYDLSEQLEFNTTLIELMKNYVPETEKAKVDEVLVKNKEVIQKSKQILE
jgi:hypothetical protein